MYYLKILLLRLSTNKLLIAFATVIYAILTGIVGQKADLLLNVFSRVVFASPGNSFERYGYYDPYSHMFVDAVQENFRIKYNKVKVLKKREVSTESRMCKIGFFGSTATPNKDLFNRCPKEWELYIYDMQSEDGFRSVWLERMEYKYRCLVLEEAKNYCEKNGWGDYKPLPMLHDSKEQAIKEFALQINEDKLDFLIYFGGESKTLGLILDDIDTPIIINYPTGSVLQFNDKIDYNIYVQPQKFFEFNEKERVLNCGVLNKKLTNSKVCKTIFPFNHRDIRENDNIQYEKRDKKIVYHGNLYKLCNNSLLKVICDIMKRYPEYEFLYCGSSLTGEEKKINAFFKKYRLDHRIYYLGNFNNQPNINGEYVDSQWVYMCNMIRNAKLYINGWPTSGGNSTYQAFALGVPCPMLALNYASKTKKINKEETYLEMFGLETDESYVYSIDEYRNLCFKILVDDELAKGIIEKQYKVVEEIKQGDRFWNLMLSIREETMKNHKGGSGDILIR